MRNSAERVPKIEPPLVNYDVSPSRDLSETQLWNEYVIRRDVHLREKILMRYSYLVRQVLGRMKVNLVSHLDHDDLESAGTISLIQSVDRFDPHRGIKFETFAYRRIQGGILDYLRKLDYLSRSSRDRLKKFRHVVNVLQDKLGRAPHDQEIMNEMKISPDDLKQIHFEIMYEFPLSLEYRGEGSNNDEPGFREEQTENSAEIEITEKLEKKELIQFLAKAIDGLPERERTIISLYYHEDLTFKEIGAIFKVSESRICQMHTKALMEIEGKLKNADRV